MVTDGPSGELSKSVQRSICVKDRSRQVGAGLCEVMRGEEGQRSDMRPMRNAVSVGDGVLFFLRWTDPVDVA